jgi:hypothetical protein
MNIINVLEPIFDPIFDPIEIAIQNSEDDLQLHRNDNIEIKKYF